MADLETFSQRILALAVEVTTGADRVVRQCAMAIDSTVVPATPVDTGRARSNWLASLNVATDETIETHGPSAVSASIAAASDVIAKYDGDKDTSIHIANNLPYIGRLNEGWSKQAPAMFVEEAVKAGVDAVQGARILP